MNRPTTSTSVATDNISDLPDRLGRWLFRHRSHTLAPLVLVIAVAAWFSAGRVSESWIWDLSFCTGAVALLLIAEGIRLGVAGRADCRTCGRGKTFVADELLTGGVYAHVRNPLYLSNLALWVAGAMLTFQPIALLLVIVVALGQYCWIVRAEERFLLERFGRRYREYCRVVPRVVPRILPAKTADLGAASLQSFNWRGALLQEHDTIFLIFLGAWGLLGLRLGLLIPPTLAGPALGWYAILALGIPVWMVTKWVKKSPRRPAKPSDPEQYLWSDERSFQVRKSELGSRKPSNVRPRTSDLPLC